MFARLSSLLCLLCLLSLAAMGQLPTHKPLGYVPDGRDIVCLNGDNLYTRALYSNHSYFRIETSDRPIFAIYQRKRECGNLILRLRTDKNAIRLDSTEWCEARYQAGMRSYVLADSSWQGGRIYITVLPEKTRDGGLWQLEAIGFKQTVQIEAVLRPCRSQQFARNGDMGWFNDPSDYNADTLSAQVRKVLIPLISQTYFSVNGGEMLFLDVSSQKELKARFRAAKAQQQALATQVVINTPDDYLNMLGGNLVAAADGAWDGETWLHGAVGWRSPLPGWRAAYAGDFLGFPERQVSHFAAYAESQVTDIPVTLPHEQDTMHNLARGAYRWGTPMYADGYICRSPHNNHQFHHYDMNLVFVDALLWHFQFDADTTLLRQYWPLLQRHLAWEKRTWDPDADGLYDAYCCIWASDALQYSGGAVTHSSAYNYRANRLMARIATLLGEDASPYETEANRILEAMNARLWLPASGVWAEYQDALGLKRVHANPALWTIYTAIDSRACSPEQAFKATKWIDQNIPHRPFVYQGEGFQVLSTSNWQPYEWSINNVAMAENLHTALAYYEAGRADDATQLLRATIVDLCLNGHSPGNFGQLSSLDPKTGECYRDFSDVVGIASRAVVQGLFGITPQALDGKCVIRPGFPADWDSASIHTPYLDYTFRRADGRDTYTISQRFAQPLQIVVEKDGKTYIGTADSTVTITFPSLLNNNLIERAYGDNILSPKDYSQSDEAFGLTTLGLDDKALVVSSSWQPLTSLRKLFNANVTDIFRNEYLSPRWPYTTLALPKQGIGDWCSTKRTFDVDDTALRTSGGTIMVAGVPFVTPAAGENIVFTSLWDNYPDSIVVPLKGRASQICLLMAGSTNPMQSQFVNGEVTVTYKDGTTERLMLRNPDNWIPIEQDYDERLSCLPQPRPWRLSLKTGAVSRTLATDNHVWNTTRHKPVFEIPGGAATMLVMPTDKAKRLKSLTLKTTANDVVIGLLALTMAK